MSMASAVTCLASGKEAKLSKFFAAAIWHQGSFSTETAKKVTPKASKATSKASVPPNIDTTKRFPRKLAKNGSDGRGAAPIHSVGFPGLRYPPDAAVARLRVTAPRTLFVVAMVGDEVCSVASPWRLCSLSWTVRNPGVASLVAFWSTAGARITLRASARSRLAKVSRVEFSLAQCLRFSAELRALLASGGQLAGPPPTWLQRCLG